MRRRIVQRWLIFLLPLFALRAFVPAGFMASHGADGWALVFCSGVVEAASRAHQDGHAHHAHGHEHGHELPSETAPSGESHVSACPFSLVASGASASIGHASVEAVPPSDEPVHFDALLRADTVSLRAHRIRGPPQLS